MSTHFYVRYNHCHSCGRYDQHHLAKRLDANTPVTFAVKYGKTGEPDIRSVEDWISFTKDKIIVDDHGQEYTHEQFWHMMNILPRQGDLSINQKVHSKFDTYIITEGYSLDKDGYLFYGGDF